MSGAPRALPPALVLCLLSLTSPALAQGVDEFGAYGGKELRHYESPQTMAFEFRVGPYLPDVDREFADATPFRDVFGTKNRYHLAIELDWQMLRIPGFGTFGPGVGIGYTSLTGRGFISETGERAEEETSLNILPAYLVGVLRADFLARNTFIPLVPYVKAGLGAAAWRTRTAGETSRTADGLRGRGLSYGTHFALGGMFLLDVLDPDAAVEMEAGMGINNTYFFFEWFRSDLDGFGSGRMQLGTSTWVVGLAFEF